jgi:hypothetical protein
MAAAAAGFYARSALDVELAHGRADFGRDGGLGEGGENGVGDDVLGDGALLGVLGLHGDLNLGSGFFFAAREECERQCDDAEQKQARREGECVRGSIAAFHSIRHFARLPVMGQFECAFPRGLKPSTILVHLCTG